MKKYFYAKGNKQEGPLTLEELKKADIKPETLVWYEGLSNWERAKGLEELKEIFELIPPSLDTEISISSSEPEKKFHDNLESFERKKQKLFSNLFSFKGRIRRTEYILTIVFCYVFIFIATIILNAGGEEWIVLILSIFYLLFFIALIAQGAKRCHDRGNSGWFQFIPFYGLWMIFAEGESSPNKYGPNPKGF